MSDIVNELRDRSYATKAKDPLRERAADEIERLRRVLATQECDILKRSLLELIQKWNPDVLLRELGTAVSDNCVTGNQREMEYPQHSLTTEEREAIDFACMNLMETIRRVMQKCHADEDIAPISKARATLRALLERMK